MKRHLFPSALLSALSLLSIPLCAQVHRVAPDSLVVGAGASGENVQPSIVDRINRVEPGKGRVRILQDDELAARLGKPSNDALYEGSGAVVIDGWRIQVFAGNNQRSSKEEAFRKEADVKSAFPELATYVQYTAPFWRLRVGNFQTIRDANDMLNRLKRAFPSYGREMSIVKEKIVVERD